MIEFQKIPGSAIFQSLQYELIDYINLFKNQTDIRFYGSFSIGGSRQETVTLKSGLPLLPFIKRVVVIIAPPYNPRDVQVFDKRFANFGRTLKNELAQFWNFGKRYHCFGEEQEDENYRNSILKEWVTAPLVNHTFREPLLEYYVFKRFDQDQQNFAEARN